MVQTEKVTQQAWMMHPVQSRVGTPKGQKPDGHPSEKPGPGQLQSERAETERVETERAQTERVETNRAETEWAATERAETVRAETERAETD